jgi:hypothetical protein
MAIETNYRGQPTVLAAQDERTVMWGKFASGGEEVEGAGGAEREAPDSKRDSVRVSK